MDLLMAVNYFTEVQKTLETGKPLPWSLGLDSLKAAYVYFTSDEAQKFIDEDIMKVLTLMTSQSPAKLGIMERNIIEESMITIMKIVIKGMELKPLSLLLLSKILDPKLIFYSGLKSGFNVVHGYPGVRTQMIRKFFEFKGFSILEVVLQNPNIPWLTGEFYNNILSSLNQLEISPLVEDKIKESLVVSTMNKILTLQDDILKRESTDILTSIIQVINIIVSSFPNKSSGPLSAIYEHFFSFWFRFILKSLNSSSLVFKLFGWDQLNEMILEVKSVRPLASSYIAQEAGTEFINGVYKLAQIPQNDTDDIKYIKYPEQPGIPLLTIFQCVMRPSKAKWWFISHADIEKPGTDKDIDYYLNIMNSREPPLSNWAKSNGGLNLKGIDPAPKLVCNDFYLPPGVTRDMYMDKKLIQWCEANNLISIILGSSTHREIISRAVKYILFLAEYEVLSKDMLQSILKGALSSSEIEITDELFNLLFIVSSNSQEFIFESLVDLSMNYIDNPEYYPKIIQFLEKFVVDEYKFFLSNCSPASLINFLSLVWKIYNNPEFDNLKNSSHIQDLLSFLFKLKGGQDIAFSRMKEAKDQLDILSLSVDYENKTIISPTNEVFPARLIQTLHFLISKNTGSDIGSLIETLNIQETLIKEIQRFVISNRDSSSKSNPSWYLNQLHIRLQVLRKYFLYSFCKDLSQVHELWEILSSTPMELEQFLLFLKGDIVNNEIESIFIKSDALTIFKDYICHPLIDWSTFSINTFDCFKFYFIELEQAYRATENNSIILQSGLPTIWRIIFLTNNNDLLRDVTNLLMEIYERLTYTEVSPFHELIELIFDHLRELASKIKDNQLDSENQSKVGKVLYVLLYAIHKFSKPNTISHVSRSSVGRFSLNIYYRRMSYHYNQHTQMDTLRIDKGSDGLIKIEIHPYHTVKMLKQKIIEAANLDQNANVSLDNYKDALDNTKISQLHLREGQEITVSYQSNYTGYGNYYSANNSLNNSFTSQYDDDSGNDFTQLLIQDYSKFDLLLTLCQLENSQLPESAWNIIISLPTQANLLELIQDSFCLSEPDLTGTMKFSNLFEGNSWPRTAYLLQIIVSILLPAPELNLSSFLTGNLKDSFIQLNGISSILELLLKCPFSHVQQSANLSVIYYSLMVLNFFLTNHRFDQQFETSRISNLDDSLIRNDNFEPNTEFLVLEAICKLSDEDTRQLLDKLLNILRVVSSNDQETNFVHSALVIITYIIRSPSAAEVLTAHPYTQQLIVSVIKNPMKKMREIASDFAIQFGRTQSDVFKWLVQELENLLPNDEYCCELFFSLSTLLLGMNQIENQELKAKLASIISRKLIEYPRTYFPVQEERYALLGLLELFFTIMGSDPTLANSTEFGSRSVYYLLHDFMFCLESKETQNSSLCDTVGTRQAGFRLLGICIKYSQESFQTVLDELTKLTKTASSLMQSFWGLQVSNDIRKSDVPFVGLKNQGCTCYMNSLLQILFMSTKFREAILATPIQEKHRSTIWHISDIDLIGRSLLFEYSNSSWRSGQVVGFDPESSFHRIQYFKPDGSLDELATFNIYKGRYQRETGRVKIFDNDPIEDEDQLTEREDAAIKVLEQLQRTFYYMKYSKRKFFDPRPFVDACKTLNLNFNVYHQNDAAEFYDQLLDRIETATKGKYTKVDMWNDIFMKDIFGGKWLSQKIPQDCENFSKDKLSCGHWQSARLENYLKVELLIRGKEHISESLDSVVQGELFDGDNKIHCDVCSEKKAAVRRTCFGELPNTLLLHLKRFDLDFQTFETVKLNNKMEFPHRINMFDYSKEGLEFLDAKKKLSSTSQEDLEGQRIELSYQSEDNSKIPMNNEDYEYELDGVLVHAGIAQGGHYYSFIRDQDNSEHWYRFDDEDVTPFNPQYIPFQCYGGSINGSQEEERSANALMLIYTKVKPKGPTQLDLSNVKDKLKSKLIDGNNAFRREVEEANLQHTLTCILIDSALNNFVQLLLGSLSLQIEADREVKSNLADLQDKGLFLNWSFEEKSDLPDRTVDFGTSFLLDVVLHCRERPSIRGIITALKESFEIYPHLAKNFILKIVSQSCSWLNEYLLQCTDPLARGSFVQLVVFALSILAPKDAKSITPYCSVPMADLRKEAQNNASALCALFLRLTLDIIFKSINYIRTSDEVFVLIRDLAAIPSIGYTYRALGVINYISFFIMPESVPPNVVAIFEKYIPSHRVQSIRSEFNHLLPNIFEAIASLLGIPQIHKVNLLQEKSYWDSELIPEVTEALTQIFRESCRNENMDIQDLLTYMEKVMGQKPTNLAARNIIEMYGFEGKLNLEGFIKYYVEQALNSPKLVWRDLHAFGYRNDLSRDRSHYGLKSSLSHSLDDDINRVDENKEETGNSTSEIDVASTIEIFSELAESSKGCITNILFYEIGLFACESAAKSIAFRICTNNLQISLQLINQALARLFQLTSDTTWRGSSTMMITDFFKLLVSIEDEFQSDRLHEILLSQHYGFARLVARERLHSSENLSRPVHVASRYVQYTQDLISVKGVLPYLHDLAEQDEGVRLLRGSLKMTPGCNLTYDEENVVRTTVIIVEGAGVPEINGEYTFTDIKFHAGYYSLYSNYNDSEAHFTLYKCSLRTGGFQWFISLTPIGHEPGTSNDVDFYYSTSRPNDILPPEHWLCFRQQSQSSDPAPRVRSVSQYTAQTPVIRTHQLPFPESDSEDSEPEGSYGVHDHSALDDSFASAPYSDI